MAPNWNFNNFGSGSNFSYPSYQYPIQNEHQSQVQGQGHHPPAHMFGPPPLLPPLPPPPTPAMYQPAGDGRLISPSSSFIPSPLPVSMPQGGWSQYGVPAGHPPQVCIYLQDPGPNRSPSGEIWDSRKENKTCLLTVLCVTLDTVPP